MDTVTNSEDETAAFARILAAQLKFNDIVLLSGPLGSGKSVLARALIRTLCGQADLEVPSPTFTLLQTYTAPQGPLFHFDLYRIEEPGEIYELGWHDACAAGLVIAEWPERLGALMPAHYWGITIASDAQNPARRVITVRQVPS